ncbi:putative mannosyltransferase [Chlamydoabsidia padenii]|nr:putative mannosyltransferase [Chlamydoabsidia padenii]
MLTLQSLRKRATLRTLSIGAILIFTCVAFLHIVLSGTSDTYRYRPQPNLHHPNPQLKAAFVTFTKSDTDSLSKLRSTIRDLQDMFNHDHGYPYIIFSDQGLSPEFKELVSAATRHNVRFELIDKAYYGYPDSIDMAKADKARQDMKDIIFGSSEDYRFQARFMAGLIFKHPAMADLDYYWRFEIGTKYLTPIQGDPFQYMMENGKKLSFIFALYEYHDTIPSLYSAVERYINDHPGLTIHQTEQDTLWPFMIDPNTETYNNCHFWSNFQIADLNFFKGQQYQDFFNHIDRTGGIFYERWGDPVIHTMAAAVFLRKSQIHYWETIGYQVADQFVHCPVEKDIYKSGICRPISNFDHQGYSCLPLFLQ